MSTMWADVDVLCPFYKEAKPYQIRCEGSFHGSKITNTFRGKNDAMLVFRTCCCGKYERCPQYIATNKKYEEGQ